MRTQPSVHPHDIFDQLALRLRQMVREEHANSLSGVERFHVRQASPLIVEHIHNGLVLEEGDPDFTVGKWIEQYRIQYGLAAGDQVWVGRTVDHEWHAFDVHGSATTALWEFEDLGPD